MAMIYGPRRILKGAVWPTVRYSPSIYMEGLKKQAATQTAGLLTNIKPGTFPVRITDAYDSTVTSSIYLE